MNLNKAYILTRYPDADEEIPKSLADEILRISHESKYNFIRISRKNILFDRWIKHGGWWPDYQIRLFEKGKVEWIDTIHGVPITKGKGSDLEASEKFAITHYNYESIEQFMNRLNRYTTITAKDLFLKNSRFQLRDLFDAPTKEFINRLFVWEGYKDGIHGFALSMLQSVSELVVYVKLWELEGFPKKSIHLSQFENMVSHEKKKLAFWLYQTLVKQADTITEKIRLKIKKKLFEYG